MTCYDLAVIGDHLGGFAAAAATAKRGGRVIVFERTEENLEERPLEHLNAVCGGPEQEMLLGGFFNEIGLSPFGPLGDDRMHFRLLDPPLQVVLPGRRLTVYRDRAAQKWEMAREFGDVQGEIEKVDRRGEEYRERLHRFRVSRRARRERRAVGRKAAEIVRALRFRGFGREADRRSFSDLLAADGLDREVAAALESQVAAVLRAHPPSPSWSAGLTALTVLQGGLYRNAAGQSGVVRGLRDTVCRLGGTIRPLVSLEGVDATRNQEVQLHLAAGARVQAERAVFDLPLDEALALLPPEAVRSLRRRGIARTGDTSAYGLLDFRFRREYRPEGMGTFIVIAPAAPTDGTGRIHLAAQGPSSGGAGDVECMEALGFFPPGTGASTMREEIRERLERLIPFFDEGLVEPPSFRDGSLPAYRPSRKSWRRPDAVYCTGYRPPFFVHRRLAFLRNEEYVGTSLAEGVLSGIWSCEALGLT